MKAKKMVLTVALSAAAGFSVQAADKIVGASAAADPVIKCWSGRAGLAPWADGVRSRLADPRFEKEDLVFDVTGENASVQVTLPDPLEVVPDMAVKLTLWTSKKGRAVFGWTGKTLVGKPASFSESINLCDGGYRTYWFFPCWRDPRDWRSPVVRHLSQLQLIFPYSMASGRVGIREIAFVRAGAAPFKSSDVDGVVLLTVSSSG